MEQVIRMEWMKTCCRLNIVFSCGIFLLVFIQVAFLVRMDMSGEAETSTIVQEYTARYISNIAFTFIPILLLVNIGREFDYAIVQRSLISGINRKGYFMGKLFQLSLFSLFALMLAIVFTMLAAIIYKVPVLWDIEKLALYFVVAFCLGSLALMFVFILKKRFYALGAFIAYVLLENTLSAVMAGKTILLPFQTCIRLLRHGIYGWNEFAMATLCTITALAIAYQVFRRSDLQ